MYQCEYFNIEFESVDLLVWPRLFWRDKMHESRIAVVWISFRGFARVKENRHNLNTEILMARKRSFILFIVLVLCGKISHEMMVGFNWNWTAWLTVELKLYITGSNSQAKKIFCGKSRVINRRNDRT